MADFESASWMQGAFVVGSAALAALIVKLILKLIEARFSGWVEKTQGKIDDMILSLGGGTKTWVLFVWFLAFAMSFFPSLKEFQPLMKNVMVVATTIQVAIWGLQGLRGWREIYLRRRIESDISSASALNLMSTALKAAFLICLLLICLSNLGVDIGALVAGLGIGGIAVALAAQNILGDLFGSLSIVLDKPFVVGDYIAVGPDQGTVEYIGIKTTRVRSLSGEQLVFSNKDLLESRIKNFKRMQERRVVLNFSVPSDTPLEKLQQIPAWIRSFVSQNEILRFERAHLASHGRQGASSLDFETVYWVKSPDYNLYMDVQQALYHQLLAKMAQEGLNFALPVHVIKSEEPGVVFSNEEGYDDLDMMALNENNN